MSYVVWNTNFGSHIFKEDEDGTKVLVVLETENSGKQEYLDWLALGNEAKEFVL